jgi:hypothetical protein
MWFWLHVVFMDLSTTLKVANVAFPDIIDCFSNMTRAKRALSGSPKSQIL